MPEGPEIRLAADRLKRVLDGQVALQVRFAKVKKRIAGQKELEEKFWKRVEIFTADPFDPRTRTHKLSARTPK